MPTLKEPSFTTPSFKVLGSARKNWTAPNFVRLNYQIVCNSVPIVIAVSSKLRIERSFSNPHFEVAKISLSNSILLLRDRLMIQVGNLAGRKWEPVEVVIKARCRSNRKIVVETSFQDKTIT